jgi:hypothetical protein
MIYLFLIRIIFFNIADGSAKKLNVVSCIQFYHISSEIEKIKESLQWFNI